MNNVLHILYIIKYNDKTKLNLYINDSALKIIGTNGISYNYTCML